MLNYLFNVNYKQITFENVQDAIYSSCIILNTLPHYEQEWLILNTILWKDEEDLINNMINNYDLKNKKIIIYGKNTFDKTMEIKYNQLTKLGFYNVHIYYGGMFEWVLLQDIYSNNEFPTTTRLLDILRFKPPRIVSH